MNSFRTVSGPKGELPNFKFTQFQFRADGTKPAVQQKKLKKRKPKRNERTHIRNSTKTTTLLLWRIRILVRCSAYFSRGSIQQQLRELLLTGEYVLRVYCCGLLWTFVLGYVLTYSLFCVKTHSLREFFPDFLSFWHSAKKQS